jgi:RNA polymerase sigma factor (sigma-70 family)
VNLSTADSLNLALLTTSVQQTASPSPLLVLTAGLAHGEDAAWEQFHREYGPEIFRQLLALTRGDHDLATEALQQAYLRIAKYARPCESAPVFAAWLRIVTRTALSDCRRGRRSFLDLLRRHESSIITTFQVDDQEEHLQIALNIALEQLETEDRALLETKYFSCLSVIEIAQNLSLSPKAVESRLTRARATLRRQLLIALQTK